MTILCGWKDPEEGSIWIGADRRYTYGAHIGSNSAVKWRLGEDWAVGASGHPGVTECGAELLGKERSGDVATQVRSWAVELRGALCARGWKCTSEGNDVPEIAASGLLVFGGSLYEVEPASGYARAIPAGDLAAVGNGWTLCRAAWHALGSGRIGNPIGPEERMRAALETTIALDAYCGGEPWVMRRLPISETWVGGDPVTCVCGAREGEFHIGICPRATVYTDLLPGAELRTARA